METNNSIITIINLVKQFDNLVAVDDLSLQINAGESFALLGPDGAGKTTLMRLLCGVLKATRGSIEIKGFNLAKQLSQVREYIGYMPQRFSLYESLSVMQNIRFFSDLYGIDKSTWQKRMDELLEFSRLTPYINRLARHLSGGMKQKLALICAIIHTPPVLLLDEPTTGVDPVSRRDFWKILHRLLIEGTTLLISTPYMDEAERCSRIGLIHTGKLLLVNTPSELKQQMTGEVIELKCDQPYTAGKLLESQDDVESVQAFSDKIRLLLKKDSDVQAIISLLKANGINIGDTHKTSPNIEDVFISRLKK